ncbi:MAG: 1-acyl-sn-glycerol-3-phosphate acyltransferase [Deltaproteobacteria bacterium]|nr:1-acyl-sn-glycerol-3-phosphate acyltransferase [Deltaproteobacteria bacterium]
MVKRETVTGLARRMLPDARLARLQDLQLLDAGHGYDPFGANREWIGFGAGLMRFLYEKWFRVTSHDAHHVPSSGAAILASNHSGTLPYDATMIWSDVLEHTSPPRLVRPVMDHFVPLLPIVGTFFARAGGVGGSRGNVRALLEAGELLLIFPEGTVGIGKPFRERYQLQRFRVGHAELAIRHRAPVVPVAVVGAEEQMPQLTRIQAGAKLFGAPYIPIPATLLPLPVHYHIYYGAPLNLHEDYRPEQADEPAVVREAADRVQAAVAGLITRGLEEREGVFR